MTDKRPKLLRAMKFKQKQPSNFCRLHPPLLPALNSYRRKQKSPGSHKPGDFLH